MKPEKGKERKALYLYYGSRSEDGEEPKTLIICIVLRYAAERWYTIYKPSIYNRSFCDFVYSVPQSYTYNE